MHPFLDQGLARLVCRMGLAGHDELHRALGIGSTNAAVAPDRAVVDWVSYRLRTAAQNPASMRRDRRDAFAPLQPSGATRRRRPVAGTTARGRIQQETCRRRCELPELGGGDTENVLLQCFRRSQPAGLAAGLRPQIVGCRRIPGGHMNAVGHVAHGYFVRRPARKERLKEVPAHFPCNGSRRSPRRSRGSPDRPC